MSKVVFAKTNDLVLNLLLDYLQQNLIGGKKATLRRYQSYELHVIGSMYRYFSDNLHKVGCVKTYFGFTETLLF